MSGIILLMKRTVKRLAPHLKNASRKLIARQLEWRVKRLIKKHQLKVVAITGSVGKTTGKLAIASVLRQKYRVQAHPGNFNSEIGLPMSIFEMDIPKDLNNPAKWAQVLIKIDKKLRKPFPYDVLVLEMGADNPGDIMKFMRYVTPDIGIVNAIAPAHVEQFGSVDAIAEEKMSLARGSRAVWLNAEDERVMKEAESLGQPIQTYGVDKGNVHFEGIVRGPKLTYSGRLQLQGGEILVNSNFIARHILGLLALAGAVGEELGLTEEQIKRGIEEYAPAAGRMQVLEGVDGSTIIDDTYNSSPKATIAAIKTLIDLPGRHIAILGNMNELGSMTEQAHRDVGHAAAKVDELVTIGQNAGRYMVAGAIENGLSSRRVHQCESPYQAGELVKALVKKGDVVLAKGSQNGVFAEEAVAKLLANQSDRSKLVRQGEDWQEKKRVQFRDAD